MSDGPIGRLLRLAFWGALVFAYVCAVMPAGPEIGGNDKVGHVTAFVTLAMLARLGWPGRRAVLLALALVGFGAFIEISQAVPMSHRDADIFDVVADTGGVAAGLLFGAVLLWAGRRLRFRPA